MSFPRAGKVSFAQVNLCSEKQLLAPSRCLPGTAGLLLAVGTQGSTFSESRTFPEHSCGWQRYQRKHSPSSTWMVSPIPVAEEPPRTAFVFIDLVPSLKIQSGWNFWGERCFSYTGLFIEEGGWDPCVVACSAGLCSAPAPPPHPRLLTQHCLQCSCLL